MRSEVKCPSPDFPASLNVEALHDFYFETLPVEDARQLREHLTRCQHCSEELEQLRLTTLTLRALPDEELPRRIAFVSDKVFTPSPFSRFVQSFWLSGTRMASAAALVLAGALVFHAYHHSETRPAVVPAIVQAVDYRPQIQAEVNAAVAQAVADAEARYDAKLKRVVDANEVQKQATMVRVEELLEAMDRRSKVITVASNRVFEGGQ